jgi:hypothetical protein
MQSGQVARLVTPHVRATRSRSVRNRVADTRGALRRAKHRPLNDVLGIGVRRDPPASDSEQARTFGCERGSEPSWVQGLQSVAASGGKEKESPFDAAKNSGP